MTEITSKRPIEAEQDGSSKKPKLDQRERALKVVQESQVGITSYINENNRSDGGFIGSIKQLYADFQVNEIGMDGKVVHLEDEGLDLGKSKKERRAEKREQEKAETQDMSPEELEAYKEKKRLEEETKKAEEEAKPKYSLSDEDRKELLTMISEKELAEIEALYTTGNNMQTTTVFDDKQTRGKLHQLFRSAFQGTLETITSPENTFNIALAKKGSGRHKTNPQESMHHVDENGVVNYGLGPFKPYLHFTVYKENRETMEIASTISKLLRFPPKAINFAGTKDRRGVTCQRFSIHRGKVVRVSSLNKALKGSTLGGFSYEDRPLGLGDLNGNEFVITIRDLEAVRKEDDVKEVVDQCFTSLKEKGFINYYGMQRFGSFSISTHVLGVHVLKEDWKSVVELILSEQEVVAPDSVEARRIWAETANPTLTLKKMPHRFSAESSALKVLEKEQLNEDEEYSSHSYFKAIMAIPKNLRIMYGHAYQSYIWNMVATRRMELFGLELQVGDLVVDDTPIQKDDDFEEDVAVSRDTKVKALTQEDIDSGKYTIYDVVLPSPGYKIQYPTNETLKQVYVDTMAKDGLDPFKMSRRVKEFSLAGSYRNLMSRPEHLSYQLVKYSDNAVPLVRTDMEILAQKKAGVENPARIINASEDGDKLAIVLTMQLGVSSYATMALREFMKADTARFSQAMMANAN